MSVHAAEKRHSPRWRCTPDWARVGTRTSCWQINWGSTAIWELCRKRRSGFVSRGAVWCCIPRMRAHGSGTREAMSLLGAGLPAPLRREADECAVSIAGRARQRPVGQAAGSRRPQTSHRCLWRFAGTPPPHGREVNETNEGPSLQCQSVCHSRGNFDTCADLQVVREFADGPTCRSCPPTHDGAGGPVA